MLRLLLVLTLTVILRLVSLAVAGMMQPSFIFIILISALSILCMTLALRLERRVVKHEDRVHSSRNQNTLVKNAIQYLPIPLAVHPASGSA